MTGLEYVLLGILFAVAAVAVFFAFWTTNANRIRKETEAKLAESEKALAEARANADKVVKNARVEAKEIAIRECRDFDRVQRDKNLELQKTEKRIQKREEAIEKKALQIDEKEKDLKRRSDYLDGEERRLSENLKAVEANLHESQTKLENVARLSLEEARQQLVESIEADVRKSLAAQIKQIEDEAQKTSEERARGVIATAIQRLSNEFVTDACVSVINLPSDDMKGRIIGREGRNIRAIEQVTGVDLIIDDTPEAVIVSCFNPLRREIGKVAIERLVADGRIHPARISEVVQKVGAEFDQMIREAGERSAFECGVQGLHPELIIALGKLKFRTTGQQSVLQHSMEAAHIAGILAGELEANARLAKRAALLHDIGKALDEEVEGHHALIGSQLAQRCGESPEVVEAIARHHAENAQGMGMISVITQCANTLSAFRPGARKEFLEKAIERLRDLEATVSAFAGVDQAYVIRSGREIRAMVSPSLLDDEAVTSLARSVAKRVRSDSNYQGPVKVTMIRESRITEVAK